MNRNDKEHPEPNQENCIEEHPELIIPQLKISEKKYGYMERDPNKKLTYYERAMYMFEDKNKIPFKKKTPWGKTKSIISMTFAVVLTPILFVVSLPFLLIGLTIAFSSLAIVFISVGFYEASTYLYKNISNFVDNFV
jgi:hypothetical protein